MKKRKGYRAGTSSVRQDYRQGGRVKFEHGGYHSIKDFDNYFRDYRNNSNSPLSGNDLMDEAEESYEDYLKETFKNNQLYRKNRDATKDTTH